MRKVLQVIATTAVGMTLLSCAAPPQPGNSAAIGFGIDGFDVGAIVGIHGSICSSSATPSGPWATASDAEFI